MVKWTFRNIKSCVYLKSHFSHPALIFVQRIGSIRGIPEDVGQTKSSISPLVWGDLGMFRRTLMGVRTYPARAAWSGSALSLRAPRHIARRVSHLTEQSSGAGSWNTEKVIHDLQRTRLYRSEQFAKLQLRRLSFITRLGLWVRRNFTTLAHLVCLGLGAWAFLDTTQLVSTLLLGLSAINLHSE